ncbi:hypothetical protein A2U01_0092965, partial [Trifolium medium]|nr:hypothetical protein [Trifolium medium]
MESACASWKIRHRLWMQNCNVSALGSTEMPVMSVSQ